MCSRTCPTLLARLGNASDPMAWGEFFSRYWPVVYAFARTRGCSEHTAEEVVQDVMLTVFQQRDVFHYDPARGRFRDWLYRVTFNQVAGRRRRPAERLLSPGSDSDVPPLDAESSELTPDAAWETAFERTLLAALLNVLRLESNPREFVAFELSTLQNRPPAEVARLTGMTRNMVYKARRRLTARLRELAGDYAEEGQLSQRVRLAVESLPAPAVERSVTRSVATRRRSSL